MARWAAGVEYLGANYSGWQALPDNTSVQATLEAALSKVADHPVKVIAAGRTDAGVHGLGQVVHFDVSQTRATPAWSLGTNAHLPKDISVTWAQPVSDDFHARYSATARRYRYVILNRRTRSALWGSRTAHAVSTLDAALMHQAGQVLLGENDFSSFRAAQCQSRTAMRNVQALSVQRAGDFVWMDIQANAFLHHMVRNIIGTLMQVGTGKHPPEWLIDVLAARDRRAAGYTAPAEGLVFLGPIYPERFGLPAPPHLAFPQ